MATLGPVDNPTPHVLANGENATPLEVIGSTATDKLVILMTGLPATGKTHIAKRICRFLEFFHDIPAKLYNVGDYRRDLFGANVPASFFDHKNPERMAQRLEACNAALEDMLRFMGEAGVRVGVYDATNSTSERRELIVKRMKEANIGAKYMFIETLCDNPEILEENIRKVKLSTPDYRGEDPDVAVKDFLERRRQYESVYTTLGDDDANKPYIKVTDCKKFVVNNIRGYLPLKVVHFVMNLHTSSRTFYFSRHGQSEYNLLGKIGGDSSLSKAGTEYARRLANFAKEKIATAVDVDPETKEETQREIPARCWTSTLRRTKETVQFIDHKEIHHTWDNDDKLRWIQFRPMARRNLDELYAGTCDGMTYKEIEKAFPEEFARRQDDKLAYRYPRGESYMDVILRLEPLAHEMERTREPILIVGHQGILRILYAYHMGLDRDEAPYVSIPLNTVIQLSPHAYGCDETRTCLMEKSEMLKDGQDEPVTSMPLKQPTKPSNYSPDDPIMHAPSC